MISSKYVRIMDLIANVLESSTRWWIVLDDFLFVGVAYIVKKLGLSVSLSLNWKIDIRLLCWNSGLTVSWEISGFVWVGCNVLLRCCHLFLLNYRLYGDCVCSYEMCRLDVNVCIRHCSVVFIRMSHPSSKWSVPCRLMFSLLCWILNDFSFALIWTIFVVFVLFVYNICCSNNHCE